MLLSDITKILRVLLAAFGAVASQDELTQRRVGQIGEVIGAVEDVAEDEEEKDSTVAQRRVEEAHDIIHRVAAILAMEDEGDDGGGGREDEPLAEVPWDGTLDGETIELKEDEENEDSTVAEKRIEEAHDIIHRVAAILAMEPDSGGGNDEPLAEVPWDGTLEGETIELKEDELE